MNAIELLEEGYKNQDWSAIAAAYQMLTGKTLSLTETVVVPKKRGRPKKIGQATITGSPKKGMSLAVTKIKPEEFYGNFLGKTRLENVKQRPNWFAEQNANKDKSDEVFKKKVYKKTRTLPPPDEVKKRKYVCRKCGGTDTLYPSQVILGQFSSKGYYCNSCCGNR